MIVEVIEVMKIVAKISSLCEVLRERDSLNEMAWWLSWLERRPVTAEVAGSNPARVVCSP